MSYSKQNFWAFDTYTHSKANKTETNILEHQHSLVLDSNPDEEITNIYAGIWTAITSSTSVIANKLDDKSISTVDSNHLFSLCNSGTSTLNVTPINFHPGTYVEGFAPNDILAAFPRVIAWTTEYFDLLNEFNGNTFVPQKTGSYRISSIINKSLSVGYAYHVHLEFFNSSSSQVMFRTITKLTSIAQSESFGLNAHVNLEAGINYQWRVSSAEANVWVSQGRMSIKRLF